MLINWYNLDAWLREKGIASNVEGSEHSTGVLQVASHCSGASTTNHKMSYIHLCLKVLQL